MPILKNAKTVDSRLSWSSTDGKIKIYDVVLSADGNLVKARTYSGVICKQLWAGDVETYEKTNKNGTVDTYVRQAPKENSPYAAKEGNKDQYTMYLSYAKDVAIALIETSGFTKSQFDSLLEDIVAGGKYLFDNRPSGEESNKSLNASPDEDIPIIREAVREGNDDYDIQDLLSRG